MLQPDGIKFQSFKQEETPTYRIGNLTINSRQLAYSSYKEFDRVIVHQLDNIFSNSLSHNHPVTIPITIGQIVTSVKFHSVNHQEILVITTLSEILIYRENGQQLLFKYQHEESKQILDLQFQFLTSSTAQAYDGSQYLIIINSDSNLFVTSKSDSSFAVQQIELGKQIENPTTMDSNQQQMNLFISTDLGCVFVLSTQTQKLQLKTMINLSPEDKTPITTLKAFDNYLACGNLSGQITIIETNNFSFLFTITAHVRFITGLEYIQEMNCLVSYSEDTFIQIWKINKDQIKLENTICINDSMIYACVPYNKKLIAATYDTSCLTLVKI